MSLDKPSFALFDVDNTLYDGHSLFGIIEAQQQAGLLPEDCLAHISEPHEEHQKGEREYEDMAEAMLKRYAKALQGIKRQKVYDACLQHFKNTDKFFNFAQPVIDLLKPTHDIIIVSAMPDVGCQAVAEVLQADRYYSSELMVEDGLFTGNVGKSLTARQGKKEVVDHVRSLYSDTSGSFAFGDSEGDVEMLRSVGHAVCINPSNNLRTEAEERGWNIATPEEAYATVQALVTSK